MRLNTLEIFSGDIRKETVRQGGWRRKEWKRANDQLIVGLMLGYLGEAAGIEFKKKCDGVGLYCFAMGKVEEEI